jgi:hypothetical protein
LPFWPPRFRSRPARNRAQRERKGRPEQKANKGPLDRKEPRGTKALLVLRASRANKDPLDRKARLEQKANKGPLDHKAPRATKGLLERKDLRGRWGQRAKKAQPSHPCI